MTTTKLQAAQDFVEATLPFTTMSIQEKGVLFLTDDALNPELTNDPSTPCGRVKTDVEARLLDVPDFLCEMGCTPGTIGKLTKRYANGDAMILLNSREHLFLAREWEEVESAFS